MYVVVLLDLLHFTHNIYDLAARYDQFRAFCLIVAGVDQDRQVSTLVASS